MLQIDVHIFSGFQIVISNCGPSDISSSSTLLKQIEPLANLANSFLDVEFLLFSVVKGSFVINFEIKFLMA